MKEDDPVCAYVALRELWRIVRGSPVPRAAVERGSIRRRSRRVQLVSTRIFESIWSRLHVSLTIVVESSGYYHRTIH